MKKLAILKFRVIEAWESAKTENTIHFEPHTFHIFCILAHPAAFVSAWLDMEDHMTLCSESMQAKNFALRILQIQH